MVEAYRQAFLKQLDLDEAIFLKKSMIVGGTGILQRSAPGTRITYSRLIELMMIESDNTATNILINKLGMKNINETAAFMGCKETRLVNLLMKKPYGIKKGVNYTSVHDLMLILERIYNDECLGHPYDQKMIGIMLRVKNRQKIPLLLPPGCKVAHKTGCISRHEHDAGIVYTKKGAYVICVMSTNLSNASRGKKVIAEISRQTYYYFTQKQPAPSL